MERTMANKLRYEAEAPTYDKTRSIWVKGPFLRMEAGLIVPHLQRGSTLDVGYGTGRLANVLGANLVGIDISRPSLQIAKSKSPEIDVVCADAVHLPFRPSVFSNVVCSRSIKFFAGLKESLNEFGRVAVPGGEVILTMDYCRDYLAYRFLVPLIYRKTKYESHYGLADLQVQGAPLLLHDRRYFASIPPFVYERVPVDFVPWLAWLDSFMIRFVRGWCALAAFKKPDSLT